ncbi:hypothetical protein T484DRAFT_1818713 [Baffinella frigidus]|nr:hypothetical protein T484DRAFT_1818713 [Cryptophyta sp. CCMP2293]
MDNFRNALNISARRILEHREGDNEWNLNSKTGVKWRREGDDFMSKEEELAGKKQTEEEALQSMQGADTDNLVLEAASELEGKLREVLKLNPKHAAALTTYANLLMEFSDDFEGAEVFLKRAVEEHPDYPPALASYARLLRDFHRDADRAKSMLARAIQAGPDHPIVEEVRNEPEWDELVTSPTN